MRDYVLPAATFQQEFQLLAAAVQQTLYTCIVGPKRLVIKDGLSVDADTNYGAYDPDSDADYAFLALPAGERVDAPSVDVRLKDVYGRYATISDAASVEVGANANEVTLHTDHEATKRFAAFSGASSYDRLSDLGERDVRVDDHLKITHEGGTLWTQVAALIQSQSAAVCSNKTGSDILAADANDSVNPPTNSTADFASAVVDDVDTGRSAAHYATVVPANAADYQADLAGGYVDDVYTCEIIFPGALGTAKFKVTSRNGDNVASVTTPVDNATSVAVGTHNLGILMDDATTAFVVGEKWTVTVDAVYDKKVLTVVADSTYAGLVDTTYQIKVVKGGTWAESPKVSVTTNNNIDSSGAAIVTGAGDDIALGTLGAIVEFKAGTDGQGGLLLGDIYNVAMTAAADNGARTIRLRHPIPKLDDAGDPINAAGADLVVKFLVKQTSHTIPATEYPDPGDLNWELDGENRNITLKSNIEITDATVTESGGLMNLPVEAGEIAIYYTAALSLEANRLGVISSLSSVDEILGDVVPENEAAFGVDMALRNSGGVPVYYLTTAGDSTDDYSDALGEAEKNDDLYFMVPMSHSVDVQSLVKSHAVNMSSETNGLERIAIVNRTVADAKDLFVTRENDTAWTGYIALGPETSPAQYRQVTMPGAEFITAGVQPGDILKTNFAITVNNEETSESYVVESVTDEENLLIASGPAGPVGSVGSLHRIEVTHTYTSLEKAELAAAQSESFGDRRVTNIFPDQAVTTAGDTVEGFYLAAAYAGIKSSVVAHQPITNVGLTGFLSVPKVLNGFNREELNEIAGGGTTIISQELEGGEIFIRHSLTTDMSDVNHSELSITTNVDAITKYLRQYIKPLIGQYNISPEFLIMLETLAAQRLDFLIQETQTVKAGPQIVEVGSIRALQDPDVRTKVLMTIPLELPYAANNIVTKLVIV